MNEQNQRKSDSTVRLLLLAGLLAALALRVYHLGLESLWYDETVSAYLSSLQPAEILRHTAGDIHPPGYYLMLFAWRAIAQPTLNFGLEYLLGWSSVAWGMLTVALLYPLGRKLLDRQTALLVVWLAAINPFHIWYSQEVRMYTMGATLGLLCLWSALKWKNATAHRWLYLAAYAIFAAVGLYTLYYFALLLVAVNVIVLILLWMGRDTHDGPKSRSLLAWIGAQLVVLLLYAPWLPTLWRQATNPPVPPWRLPWESGAEFLQTVGESLSALLVGQTPPAGIVWPWALLTVAATVLFVVLPIPTSGSTGSIANARNLGRDRWKARITLLAYVFLPITILYLMTLWVTPVYHVRYLFTYAPPFMLILAASVSALWAKNRWLGMAWLVLMVGICLAGLQQFWFNPSYRADDHRAAVAELADNWQPGDVILVNAGWAYTALDTYWPQEIDGPYGSAPPPLPAIRRFNDMPDPPHLDQPTVAVTGSVDGADSLGWGDPNSDFFAVSGNETIAAMDQLAEEYARIWHYRIYDTVSDPEAVIRDRLGENGELLWEKAYPGRDYLRVQLFDNQVAPPIEIGDAEVNPSVDFGDVLRLDGAIVPSSVNAGDNLYVKLLWSPTPALSALETGLNMSLRLYDPVGNLVVQSDGPPQPSTDTWRPAESIRQPMSLALPAAARPGPYTVELVVYRQDDGIPLPLPDGPQSVDGQRLQLDTVDVLPAKTVPVIGGKLAGFDYIDLIDAKLSSTSATPGSEVRLDLVWLPNTNQYTDNYVATVALRNENNDVVASWAEPLGSVDYKSSEWPAELPVMDMRSLTFPDSIMAGDYTVTLSVERSSDSLPIRAAHGWLPTSADYTTVADLTIE